MKKISIIIILCIIGCAGTKGKKSVEKDSQHKSEINVYSQHWNISEDSLNLFLHFELPLNRFVFKKSADYFYSDIAYTLVISHAGQNIQIHRESWNETITQPYYENTRNSENYYNTERNIALIPGEYKFFLNIQDEDSRRSWQINKEYKLEKINVLGPALLFVDNVELQKSFAVSIMDKTDTLWIRTQVHLADSLPNQLDYTIIRKGTVIDSGIVSITGTGINHLYYLPIPMTQHKRGWYEIKLSCQGEKQTVSFRYGTKGKLYWTDDVDEVVGVMKYILPDYSEYKKLKVMNESEQWTYIHEYWEEKDPSPTTDENELLIQFNNRVKYVNKNFSILMQGWRSDRGRIYIIYGPPKYIDDSYQEQRGYQQHIWVYKSGKKFIFIDRYMSGDYELYREMY